MSLILKKIELSNIRSHQYVNFEPAETGITALSGANGSGKSTILDSIAWVLYGTKPHGVSKASAIIRYGTDLSKEKCFAKIWLQVGTSILRIERRIVSKTGSVECEIWEKAQGEDEYTLQAGPSVSHAEPYIKKRLKMDEKGFLAAVLVQQKQVDQLIAAAPKERAEVIEKLTGISSITAALTEARQQHNSLKKAMQNYNFDEKLLEKLQTQKDTTQKLLNEKSSKRDELQQKGSELTQTLKTSVASLREEEEKTAKLDEARTKVSTLKATIETLEAELQRATAMKQEKKNSLDSFSAVADINSFEKDLNQKRRELRNFEIEVQRHNDMVAALQEDIKNNAAIIKASSYTTLKGAQEQLKAITNEITSNEEQKAKITEQMVSRKSAILSMQKAANIISQENGRCPTCLQSVDDVQSAVDSLQTQIDSNISAQHNDESTIRSLDDLLFKKAEDKTAIEAVIDAMITLRETQASLKSETSGHDTDEAQKTALEKEVSTLEKSYAKIKMAAEIKREYDQLLANAVEISDNIEKNRGELSKNEAFIKESKSLSLTALNKLRDKTQELNELRNNSIVKFSEIKEECSLLNRELQYITAQIDSAQQEANKYAEMLTSVEASGNTVAVLEEFREERIKNSVPIVGAYASDLLSRFTDGKFTQLKLDKKFNATVALANGVERPVGLLSGGELSSAAIALRLAISLLLNAGSSNTMLSLDEVLVSQDAERSELILTTIRDVFQGQLVIISHGPNTNEIADKVIEL